ncbi:hypothetical protein Aduo_013060 [Ancylostoma duodenale]
MTCNFARSKPVHDMYELANIASIVYGSNWGPHARERELLKDDSKCLNTVGLSLAMAAHKRNCFKYARAIAMAQGQAFTHSAIFDSHPGFDLDAYFMQALARCEKIVLSDIEESPLTPTLIVLPHSFRNVAKEIKVEDQVNIYAYKNFYDLARVLTERPITASIIMVWPLERPTNDAARKVVLQLERHLRCGGTLQMFPSPYEDAKSELWEERRNTVSAVVEYLQGPERGFEALVVDQYTPVRHGCRYTHPAGCLGTNPRKGDQPFQGWQIHTFLQKIRVTLKDVLLLPPFQLREKPLHCKEAKDAARANKPKEVEFETLPDPHHRRFKENQHPHGEPASKRPKQYKSPRMSPLKERHVRRLTC